MAKHPLSQHVIILCLQMVVSENINSAIRTRWSAWKEDPSYAVLMLPWKVYHQTTKRTIRGEAHLLTFHLSKDGNEKITIFSDHSGEDYRTYANQKDEIKNDVLIQNADRILFFVDIPSLLDAKCLPMIENYKNLLSNMKSAGIFRQQTKTTLLFNKIDIVNDDAKKERYEEKKKFLIPIFRSIIEKNEIETIELTSNNIDKSDDLKSLLQDIAQSDGIQTWIDNNESDLDWVKKFIKEQ